ncbi:unnamed protein product [Ceutorhynchus assimilis]|uniref:CLIP domain-containing serine protease n=1 Tax=Ceutorhynchus assimilis TaxID=467358 RepID=A0A9N9N2J9_9CUCU|nr:unnamed protein product [Ceutorhynchus assimilis]
MKFLSAYLYFVSVFTSVKCSGALRLLFMPRFFVSQEEQQCEPPLGDDCLEITQCPFFVDLLDKTPIPRPRSIIKIIKQHQCGFAGETPKVCCFRKPTTTTTTTTQRPARSILQQSTISNLYSHRNFELLPVNRCGPIANQVLTNRITAGRKTSLEEFPWMALIAYNTPDVGIEFRCGGTVITENYILTAAHCILNSTLIGVRLGEYDLSSNKQDCEGSYCAPPVQDFYIKDTVVHSDYNPKTFDNDIALLRLANNANFSYSNVQPICLPVSEKNDDLTGKFAIVSGWGVTEDGHKSSVLLKASVPVLPLSTCQKIYDRFAPIKSSQICAGGYKGQDSCAGDSGGPLIYTGMVDGSPRYIQYGIVSFGPRECGTEGQPGIYTRVGSHLMWILDNLKQG